MFNNLKTKLIFATATIFCSLGFAQTANAVVDFESVAVGTYSSFSSDGITFSLSSGDITVANDNTNGAYVLAPPDTHFLDNRNGSGYGSGSFIFDLAGPVNYFGLQIGATNSVQTLSAYDYANNLLGFLTIPNQVSDQPYPYTGFYSLNFLGMGKVTLSDNYGEGHDGDWIVVDNVTTVSVVPEPETYAMLLVGLGLIGFMARRRREDFSF